MVLDGEWSEAPHGHHYGLKISWSPRPANFDQATSWIENEIVQKLDQQALNSLLNQSSGEKILDWVSEELQKSPYHGAIVEISLEETTKNSFTKSLKLN